MRKVVARISLWIRSLFIPKAMLASLLKRNAELTRMNDGLLKGTLTALDLWAHVKAHQCWGKRCMTRADLDAKTDRLMRAALKELPKTCSKDVKKLHKS